jgi:hypothetical protein
MKVNKILGFSLSFLCMNTTTVFAENKYYGGIELGYVYADTGAAETADSLAILAGQTVFYTYEDSAPIGRIFLGYDIDKSTAVEVGYFATGETENTYTTAGAGGTGSAVEDFSVSGVDLSVILRPSGEPLFLRLGAHYSEIESTAALSFGGVGYSLTSSGWATAWGTGLLGGIGYDYAMEDSDMKIRGAYTYYNKLGGVSGADMHAISVGLLF